MDLAVTFGTSKEQKDCIRTNALTHITVPVQFCSKQYQLRLYYTLNNQKTWRVVPMKITDPKGVIFEKGALILADRTDISFKLGNVKSDVAKTNQSASFRFILLSNDGHEPTSFELNTIPPTIKAIQKEPFSIETAGRRKKEDELQQRIIDLEEQVRRIPELEETIRNLRQQLHIVQASQEEKDPVVNELSDNFELVSVDWRDVLEFE
jgi:hypothetical protein